MNVLRKPFRWRNYGAVFWIIGINILVFLGGMAMGRGQRFVNFFLGMTPDLVEEGWIWTFVTYMFVHGGISHILFNMLALFFFGLPVERQMGSPEFILFYFITGILAGFFSFLVYVFMGAGMVTLIGASGAVFAVQLAYAVFFPNSVIYLWGILPIKAPVMVLGFTGLEIFLMITGMGGNVAHMTHLAGFGVAWLYFLIRFGVNPWRRLTGW
ncbi:MAG: rhomboid family intramembrane serine protease [Treponema sp.]|jgi:membrane associated rhomboid family serine protease|nr:rhomboid family intramembrane serine protease [Treponema sp.]